jgi:hypothetical protein
MKQSAVEWLEEQFEEIHTIKRWEQIVEQAKEMEKQQIIDALHYFGIENAEQYYNETFNK